METFTEKSSRRNFALHFTCCLFIVLLKILPHSKTIKSAKKLSVFAENASHCLSNFLQKFFETLIIFLKPKIKLIEGIFDFQK